MSDKALTQRSLYPWLVKSYLSLAEDLAANRLHHAVLLSSNTHLGKHQLVERVTQLIHCQQPINNKACRQCQDCQLHLAGTHADFYEIVCLENKAQISIEQIRQFSRKITDTGLVNQRRVVFIRDIDTMTESAANALLKVLEEPPAHVYFLLTTSQLSQVTATVLSRCLKITIAQPPTDKLVMWLNRKTQQSISVEQLALLGNSPLAALDALNNNLFESLNTLLSQCNTLYLAWQNKQNENAYSAVIDLAATLQQLQNDKKNPVELSQLIAILSRINQWVIKGQLLKNTTHHSLASELIESTMPINAKCLTMLDSQLHQLRHLLLSNSGVNGVMQLQNSLIKVTDDITKT